MHRRIFLKIAGAGATALALTGLLSCEKSQKPNVILIITDDQGYGDLACHGNPIIKTPNMDKLRGESVRLTNFHVGPTCAPTRASLLTGRHGNRTGVWHTIMGRSLLRQDEITMGDVFRDAGYTTAIFGKWHLGDNYPFRPQDRGFDESIVHGGGGITQTPDYWDNDYFDDTYWHNGEPTQYDGYCTDVWFDNALTFIEKNRHQPFFCYISTNAPHSPFNVDPKYSQTYEALGVPPVRARFYGMIENIDDNMARLEKHLDKLDLRDNSIFIFMTDNGTAAGVSLGRDGLAKDGYNAGMRGAKGSEYDGGHRVPCFVRWPDGDIGGGVNVNRLTAHVDLLPTLMQMCGISPKADHKMDGDSIFSLLRQPDAAWKDRTLVTDSQRVDVPIKWRKSAVMTDRWRLINGRELYDMTVDPGQQNNVAENNEPLVEKLRAAYETWWADVSQRFDEYCHILIGSNYENPVRLTAHDWHTFPNPWNQDHIRKGLIANSYWAVEIVADGAYEFALRRWPRSTNKAINAGLPGRQDVPGVDDWFEGKAFNITKAKIKIGDIEQEQKVAADAQDIVFTLDLKKGQTTLQTWLYDLSGEELGAYYVYVKKV